MAISYVGGQVAGRAGTVGTTSITFALTGGTNTTPQPRDVVVITAIVGSQGRTPAQAISGYTALGQLNANGTTYDTSLDVSWKEMSNTPDVSFTLPSTGDIADAQRYTIQVFRGVDSTGITSASATGTGTGRPDPPSITPTVAGSVVVLCGGGAAATGASYTAPTNYTTNFLTGSTADTNDAMVGSGYWTGWTSGAENPAAYTGGTTNAVDSWACYSVVLPPLAAVTRTAPTYVDSTIGGDNSLSVNSVSATAPSMSSGDLDLIFASAGILSGGGAAPGIQVPSGFTAGPSGVSTAIVGGAVNTRIQTFWKIATGSGSAATLQTVGPVNAAIVYTRFSYSGPDATTPIRQGLFGAGASSTSHVLPSMTAHDDSVILSYLSLGSAQAATPPGSMTEHEDSATFGASSADETLTADGATGTRTFTVSSATDSVYGFIEIQGAATSATHATTGALTGQGSTIAGTAAHVAIHTSTGALTGQGSSVVGSAARTRVHPSSGVLAGQGSVVAGSAARTRAHPSSGTLAGQGSTVAGSAARTRQHPASGALTGPGSTVAGSAARTHVHPSSGALVGPGAAIVGSADRSGSAGTHEATGTLVGQGSAVAGSAARLRAFAASGALVGSGSVIAGSAARVGPAVSHDATGVLVGPGSSLSGQAQNGEAPTEQEVTPTYVVGKPKKNKERKLMGGPRWQRHEIEDLRELVQARPFEEVQAEKRAQEAIAKASEKQEIGALSALADAQLAQSAQELAQALQIQQQIDQQREDEAVMQIIAELL